MQRIPSASVLECMRFVEQAKTEHRRTVKNYEFDLYVGGEREIILDDKSYHVQRGSLIFRKPNQCTVGKGDYDMFLLTLDFSGNVASDMQYRTISGSTQPICDFDELNSLPSVFSPEHFDELKKLFERLSACSPPGNTNIDKQQAYLKEFLYLVFYDAQKEKNRTHANQATHGDYVQKACEYISKNYQENINVESLAQHLNLNKNYLIKLFKSRLSLTPNRYILETRLLRAKVLLLQTNKSVQEIAFYCGFNVPSYFSKRFKERFGVLPLEFRNLDK